MEEMTKKENQKVDREAEKSIISSLFQMPEKIDEVATILSGDEFSSNVFRDIFEAIVEVNRRGEEINTVTVRDNLKGKNVDSNILDIQFLNEIYMFTPVPSQIMSFVNIVKNKYLLRQASNICSSINSDCNKGEKDVMDIIMEAQEGFYNLYKQEERKDLVEYKKVLSDVLIKIGEVCKSEDGITGIRTRFPSLDNLTSGFQKGNLIIIAARPSVGKTAFALNLAYNIVRGGYKVAFFSLEMTKEELVSRILSMESKITSSKLRSGRLGTNDMDRLMESIDLIDDDEYAKGDLYIDETSAITIQDLKNKCKLLKMREGLDIIFIDYLQLMREDKNKKTENKQQEIAAISRALKGLAKDLNIPVVALAQTKRPSKDEKRDPRPQLEDLKESGSIEQDADIVMFLHRPKDEAGNVNLEDIQLLVAKHRNGATADLTFRFDGSVMTFSEYNKRNDSLVSKANEQEET